jgi:C4-dicarboxylate-specific signal transduction histidine kinase
LAPVSADAVQIGQVLVNLIRNALDAMAGMEPERRVLAVETAATDHGVRVSVRDRGCGIPPAVLGQVFDAFFTTKRDGLGIGLALCRTIVEEHGGLLSAEPDPAGGTTFAFTLRSAARAEQ